LEPLLPAPSRSGRAPKWTKRLTTVNRICPSGSGGELPSAGQRDFASLLSMAEART
jgi:hypothetical protein